jgi:hypothetical protein
LGSRKGIGFELLGIVSALLVLIAWFVISSAANNREWGTSWSNFLNSVGTSIGGTFGILLVVTMVVILLFSGASIVRKRFGEAPQEPSKDKPEITDAGGGWQWVRIGAYSFKRKAPEAQPQEATAPPSEEARKDEVPP